MMLEVLAAIAAISAAQPAVAASTGNPVVAEYYYRIKWGSAGEFKRLYEKNHAPILRELQKQGMILKIDTEEPFTHLAGGPRWDFRVTVTYPDGSTAIQTGGAMDKAFTAVAKRLYPDKKAFDVEEALRFSLLEDHWDMIVVPVEP
jgi:hypothetical protein